MHPHVAHPESYPAAHLPRLAGIRTLIVLVMAFGYASTMGRGPDSAEWLRVFGYEPSLFALQALFFLSGYLAFRSLARHGSGLSLLASRARRTLPLLALVTAVVAFILYPLIARAGVHGQAMGGQIMGVRDLLAYFTSTTLCLDPGQPMPGALDDAHYACLLQGAIWSFRWGVIAYVGTAAAWHLGLMRDRRVVLLGAVLATLAYAVLNAGGAMLIHAGDAASDIHLNAETGLRLAYPFAFGLAAYAWRDRLPRLRTAIALLGLVALNSLLAWTPFIEIGTSLALSLCALIAVRSPAPAGRFLEGWPALALPLFVVNWPLAQVWLYLRPDLGTAELVALTLTSAFLLALALTRLPYSRRAFRPPAFSHAKTARTP